MLMTYTHARYPYGLHYSADLPDKLRSFAKSNPFLNVASNTAVAEIFGVSRQTVANWMEEHDAFRETIEELRIRGLDLVESAMLRRALGYTAKETKTTTTETGTVVQVTEKEIPPDASLIRWYLEHRNPERWGEKDREDPRGHVTVIVEDDPKRFA